MNNSDNSCSPLEDSPNKNKLPLEVSVSTLISVFFRRFLPILIAATAVIFLFVFVWLLRDYAQIISAILLGITVTIVLLFAFSLFRRKATTFDKFLKRLFDILLGLTSFILLLPFLALVSLIIKLDSKGPIFIFQKRLGKDGEAFNSVKFRTMVTNADEVLKENFPMFPHLREELGETYQLKNDPRVTKVGRFLRRSSTDEIPQIYNVIKGEMSIVGPRPLLYSQLESYSSNYIENYFSTVHFQLP
jgi:lipopolysaccharide/colanic/teichoic acid biosynthesis glycosyltransferase